MATAKKMLWLVIVAATFSSGRSDAGDSSFKASALSSSAMILTRNNNALEESGVNITGYKVYCEKFNSTDFGHKVEKKNVIDRDFYQAKLAGLEPNTKYRITIKALKSDGEGKEFHIEQTTRPDITAVPDVPRFETKMVPAENPNKGWTDMLVQWLPDVDGHPGSNFLVSYKLKGQPNWETEPLETEELFVNVTGLNPALAYEVKITVFDGANSSDSEVQVVGKINSGSGECEQYANPYYTAIIAANVMIVLIVVAVSIALVHRYKVKALYLKFDEKVKLAAERPPLDLPPEVIYNQIYDHGAGRLRPPLR